MAQKAREQRQLMRQRGAGLRDVNDPEFALDFDVGSREERRLMRQRGAGNREINNIDFGFAFATPIQASTRRSRTKSKTPATSSRTPLARKVNNGAVSLSSARSTRSQRLPYNAAHNPEVLPVETSQRKRRRLSDISNIPRSTSLLPPAGFAVDQLEVPIENQPQKAPRTSAIRSERQVPSSRFNVPSSPLSLADRGRGDSNANKENESILSELTKATTKKRKRKSIGQQSLFKKKRTSASSTVPLPTPSTTGDDSAHGEIDIDPFDLPSTANADTDTDTAVTNVPVTTSTESPLISPPVTQPQDTSESAVSAPAKRKKKRRSITGQRGKRKSNIVVPQDRPDTILPNGDHGGSESFIATDPSHTPSANPRRHSSVTHKRSAQKRPSISHDQPEEPSRAETHVEEDADETYLPDEATPELTPGPRRAKEKRKARQATAPRVPPTNRTAGRRINGFPILTHRMTNSHALPTITEENEEEEHNDANDTVDELSLVPPTITSRSTPNAVDVLAQACRENIDAAMQRLQEGPSELSRADRSRQIAALETFRSNLDIRLFDLSQSLDQRLHLETRLRKQRREKADLQARWLEVRKQRDRMALRMDAVREQHWEDELAGRRAWDISQAAYRLETAVGREDDETSQENKADLLDFSLKELGQDVSSKNGKGILNVLKGFNAQLEQGTRVLR